MSHALVLQTHLVNWKISKICHSGAGMVRYRYPLIGVICYALAQAVGREQTRAMYQPRFAEKAATTILYESYNMMLQ